MAVPASPIADDEALLDVVLYPHRSMSRRGAALLVAAIAGVFVALGLAFATRGAWPVLPFMGGEIALLWWAFRTSFRDARRYETMRLTAAALVVRQVDARGAARAHTFAPPHWLKVTVERLPGRANQLRLSSHGRALIVGRFLASHEKIELAAALRAALRRLAAPSP